MNSWFFKKDKSEAKKTESTSVAPPVINIPSIISSASPISGEYQEKVKAWLAEANEKGLDYYEFSTAIESLAGQAITEQQKFVITFAPFVASGISADTLVQSAERYLQMINNKSAQFNLELSRAMDRDIAKRGEAIKTAEAEIEALTKQIEEKAKFIQATNVEMNKAQADLTMKESSFNTAISSATEKIKSDIVKIKTHLSK